MTLDNGRLQILNSHALTTSPPETRQSCFEQGVALSINLWPALTLAVQNNWGGPDSADKRDWLAGQVVELFPEFTKPKTAAAKKDGGDSDEEPDVAYVEEFLLQVMIDEFEVNVDDDSGFDVATEVVRIRGQCAKGNFDEVDKLQTRWEAKKGLKVEGLFKKAEDEDHDTDWDTDDDEEDGSGDDDVDMGEAPPLVTTKKERLAPEVDEDGFTKVTKRK